MIEERIEIYSDGLSLEGMLVYSDDLNRPRAGILICPPHPFLGGDMRNPVITSLLSELVKQNLAVLTFNYRGIGGSETDKALESYQREFWEDSTCPQYEDKIHKDCRQAFEVLKGLIQNEGPFMVIGYSFGCLPAMELLSDIREIVKGVLISPPLVKWSLPDRQFHVRTDKRLIYSASDFACPENKILSTFERLASPKSIRRIDDTDHFFVGHEKQLVQVVMEFLTEMSPVSILHGDPV